MMDRQAHVRVGDEQGVMEASTPRRTRRASNTSPRSRAGLGQRSKKPSSRSSTSGIPTSTSRRAAVRTRSSIPATRGRSTGRTSSSNQAATKAGMDPKDLKHLLALYGRRDRLDRLGDRKIRADAREAGPAREHGDRAGRATHGTEFHRATGARATGRRSTTRCSTRPARPGATRSPCRTGGTVPETLARQIDLGPTLIRARGLPGAGQGRLRAEPARDARRGRRRRPGQSGGWAAGAPKGSSRLRTRAALSELPVASPLNQRRGGARQQSGSSSTTSPRCRTTGTYFRPHEGPGREATPLAATSASDLGKKAECRLPGRGRPPERLRGVAPRVRRRAGAVPSNPPEEVQRRLEETRLTPAARKRAPGEAAGAAERSPELGPGSRDSQPDSSSDEDEDHARTTATTTMIVTSGRPPIGRGEMVPAAQARPEIPGVARVPARRECGALGTEEDRAPAPSAETPARSAPRSSGFELCAGRPSRSRRSRPASSARKLRRTAGCRQETEEREDRDRFFMVGSP
jgi:hypothetical protein